MTTKTKIETKLQAANENRDYAKARALEDIATMERNLARLRERLESAVGVGNVHLAIRSLQGDTNALTERLNDLQHASALIHGLEGLLG